MNLLALLAFLGFPLGFLLKRITKDEIKQGKKYFVFMIRALLIIIALILMYNFKPHWILVIGIITAYFLSFNYLYFGLTYIILDNFILYVMLFIFGLPYSTLKDNKKTILKELIFFIIPLLLLVSNFNEIYGKEIASFAVGFLFTKAVKWK